MTILTANNPDTPVAVPLPPAASAPIQNPAANTGPTPVGPSNIIAVGTSDPGFNNLIFLGGIGFLLWKFRRRLF